MGTQRTTEGVLRARESLLQYLRRESNSLIMVGPVSLWLRSGLSLRRTEEMLEHLVSEGILRPATSEELRKLGKLHGYFLTEDGLDKLPPEDHSYGVV